MPAVSLNRHGASGAVIKSIHTARNKANDGMKSIATGKNTKIGPAENAIASKLGVIKAKLDAAAAGAERGVQLTAVAKAGIQALIDNNRRGSEIAAAMSQGDIDVASGALGQSDFASVLANHVAIVGETRFNGVALIDNATALDFQIGDAATDIVTYTPTNLTNAGAIAGTTVDTVLNARLAAAALSASLTLLLTDNATTSATQNQLIQGAEFAATLADAAGSAAETYEGTDVEKTINDVTLAQVRGQAGTAMTTLANQDIRSLMSAING